MRPNVVISGHLNLFKNKEEAYTLLSKYGCEKQKNVTLKTDYLIVGTYASGQTTSRKSKRAQELIISGKASIIIISELEFYILLDVLCPEFERKTNY